jgi:hypothetical protein
MLRLRRWCRNISDLPGAPDLQFAFRALAVRGEYVLYFYKIARTNCKDKWLGWGELWFGLAAARRIMGAFIVLIVTY